jgi:hypothetical protein
MNPWIRLVLIIAAALALASMASYSAIDWLRIRSGYGGYQRYGPQDQKASTILYGSSLAYDGIDWDRVAQIYGGAIESWATPGSSPSEWEALNHPSPETSRTIIVVSPYDLNEYWLSDFRANIVSFAGAIRDLQYCGSDGQFCKRILSQYPQVLARAAFPTVGRSQGVMVGIRAALEELIVGVASAEADDGPKFGSPRSSSITQKLSDWPAARLQRRLVLMRTGFQGKHWFGGPKKMALMRLLERSEKRGDVIIIVMPVSPTYRREFLTSHVTNEFEDAMNDLRRRNPARPLIRLDKLPKLDDDSMFSDLVHLNIYGQEVATAALVEEMEKDLNLR